MRRWLFLFMVIVVCVSGRAAHAACASPVAEAGAREWFSGDSTYKFCNGTTWIPFNISGTLTVCSNTAALDYDAGQTAYKYCNGANWIKVACGGSACCVALGTCSSTGTVDYFSGSGVLAYCEGTNWINMGPPPDPCTCNSPTPGQVCADGSVYAGLSPDGSVKMFTTPADAGLFSWVSNVDCGVSPGTCIDTAMVNCTGGYPGAAASCQTGAANTAFLAGLSNSNAPYAAAVYCDDLNAHGHQDWYLPAQDELFQLYTNRAAIGGFDTGGFPNSSYWSSSETAAISAKRYRFSDGTVQTNHKRLDSGNGTLSVRCVRKN